MMGLILQFDLKFVESRLRDSTSLEDAEKTRKIKALEKDLSSLNESKALYEKTREKLSIAEDQIEELKLSLGKFLGGFPGEIHSFV